jgi:tetratricopeptide (TPR) repeat protein
MSTDRNWFRNTTWNEDIEQYFFKKLSRVRDKDMQAQYLQLQAGLLASTHNVELMRVAERLISFLFTNYPDNKTEKSTALETLGFIYQNFGDYHKALDYYKQAIDYEKVFPYSITNAFMYYSLLVIKMNRTDLYDDVEKVLFEKRYQYGSFPITLYRKNSVLSIISKQKGDTEKAKYYADLAEQNVAATESGFYKHKTLGLVRERDEHLDKLMYE